MRQYKILIRKSYNRVLEQEILDPKELKTKWTRIFAQYRAYIDYDGSTKESANFNGELYSIRRETLEEIRAFIIDLPETL
jgi:gamma-glutamylcyclotransferase (GGCT)/AIG2-like uncharacterized protein YtfP